MSACGVNAFPITSNPRDLEKVGEKTALIQNKDSSCTVNALPMISISRDAENFGGQSSNHANDGSEYSLGKVTVRNLKSSNTKDAVKLSFAVSEALVIHELVKSDSGTKALPTVAVLEAAFQVKQTRLESSEDTFDCPTETSDKMDFLSDLDDLTMADAFEDVGLYFSCFSNQHAYCSNVSLVKDTPVSEDCFRSGNRTENAEHFSLQNKPSDYPTSSPKNSDPILHEVVEEISHVSATAERVGFSKVDASLQSQADLHCSDLCDLKNAAGESNASAFVIDGYKSRWLGGWTGKKEADPEQLKPKTKNISKCFVAETSFFSESADVAPDENSLVKKCANERSNIASDHSVHFEGLPDKVDEGIMVSQDVISSCTSLVDPLCSIVPCSISLENAVTELGQNRNSREGSARNCPFSSVGPQNENTHIESIFETRQDLPEFDGSNIQGMQSECNNDMKVPARKRPLLQDLAKVKMLVKLHLTPVQRAGSALSPEKDMVLSNQPETRLTRIGKPVRHDNNGYIFYGVGVMLHGKPYFCTKFSKVIQRGGGRVFKTLLCLIQNFDAEKISMAVIVCEGENRASRHLRQYASERMIPMMRSSWIVRSLYSGKLLPFTEKKHTTLHAVMGLDSFLLMELGLRKKEIKSKDSNDTVSDRVWLHGMARIGN
ncbi:hypothetical protein J1N35_036814 [Gossypium stocksii]|uniref:BRCT domain-containing protein n=1 Tax=Gossypium stocksii TaxID=47602 RepID=A0A9D3UIQ1_9ROSI|nr:hypothetical protein J1N35_036814 [Gossypium stocksii]